MKYKMKNVVYITANEGMKERIVNQTNKASVVVVFMFLLAALLVCSAYVWSAINYYRIGWYENVVFSSMCGIIFVVIAFIGMFDSLWCIHNIKLGNVFYCKCTLSIDSIKDFNKHYKIIEVYCDGEPDVKKVKVSNKDVAYVLGHDAIQYYVGWIKGSKLVLLYNEE